jgi:hypothetical protein
METLGQKFQVYQRMKQNAHSNEFASEKYLSGIALPDYNSLNVSRPINKAQIVLYDSHSGVRQLLLTPQFLFVYFMAKI